MTIAVDFDGTIVEHEYPYIGKEIPFAITALKKLQAERHLLILWSVREGDLLDEAVAFCRKRGLEFYAVNSNHPGEAAGEATPYCRNAALYIDDRSLGGLPDWGAIYEMVHNGWTYDQYLEAMRSGTARPQKKSFWQRLTGRG